MISGGRWPIFVVKSNEKTHYEATSFDYPQNEGAWRAIRWSIDHVYLLEPRVDESLASGQTCRRVLDDQSSNQVPVTRSQHIRTSDRY